MIRPTWVEIDLAAVAANLAAARKITRPGSRILAVVKGDAYGMGLLPVAQKLIESGADALGVGNVAEGLRLRQQGVAAPILVLEPVLPGWGLEEAARAGLACAVSMDANGDRLQAAVRKTGGILLVHLRLELDEQRLLPSPREWVDQWRRRDSSVRLRGLFLHPDRAPGAASEKGRSRMQEFLRWAGAAQRVYGNGVQVHVCNSSYLLREPDMHLDAVRPGSLLLGLMESSLSGEFVPVASWRTRIALVKEVPPGTGVSYGLTYQTARTTRLAALPVGYADGLRRGLSNHMQVLVRGRRVPQVGRICMDQCLVDVGAWPDVAPGETVTLLGRDGQEEIRIEEWTSQLGVSAPQLLATVGPRVQRRYGEGGTGFDGDHLGRDG